MEVIKPNLTSYQKKFLFNDARFTVTEAGTKIGKTYAHICWIYGKSHELEDAENHNYWWVAPTYYQAKIAFKRLRKYISKTNLYRFNETELTILCPNKAIIHFKTAEKPDNLYGEDVYAAVFDEAPRARPEAWYALRSTLSSTEAPCKLIGNFGGISNWVHKLKDKAKNDPAYAYYKVTCWDAIAEGILSEDEVLQAKKDLPEKIFKELYEAEASESEEQLIRNESIKKLFSNTHIEGGVKYISADIARLGKDKTIVLEWDDLRVDLIINKNVTKVNESVDIIKSSKVKDNVNIGNIIIDEDGVGGGVVDYLPGCVGFVNNAKPLMVKGKKLNFANLKSQCYYELAETINRNEMYINCDEETERLITEELEWVRLPKEVDTTKINLLSKDEVKKQIGRSPDFSDALMMRMYFKLNPNRGAYHIH